MIILALSSGTNLVDHAQQHQVAIELLFQAVHETYGIQIDERDIGYGKNGKPYLLNYPEIQFSISHCCGGVALSMQAYRTGIDIENIRGFDPVVSKKILTIDEQHHLKFSNQPEQTFFQLWTLKESYLKALGTGIGIPMNKISFQIQTDFTVQSNRKLGHFQLISNYSGFVTSVCTLVNGKRQLPASSDIKVIYWP
ncbi:MAG: 4'-phosphopantetheinyl transferase superfamily protein [Eubacteriales bacterium]|nr:4'-phosphopantetheinyl transferase superfamily protein [Eubacteriales bacterium]